MDRCICIVAALYYIFDSPSEMVITQPTVEHYSKCCSVSFVVAQLGYQAQDISEAASLLRRVRMGDQPYSDWASSAKCERPQQADCRCPCLPFQDRGLVFICRDKYCLMFL